MKEFIQKHKLFSFYTALMLVIVYHIPVFSIRQRSSIPRSSSEGVTIHRYEFEGRITRVIKGARKRSLFGLFVNCSGLPKSHILERTKSVLPFLIFKAMRILVLKLSKFRKPKALRLMTLMRLLVASSFAFE